MGNSQIRPEQLPEGEARDALRGSDIATRSLRTTYAKTFLALTILFIISLIALLGMVSYLVIEIYNSFKEKKREEKIISIATPVVFAIVIILMSVYYFKFVEPELTASDRLITDLERRATVSDTYTSLKANLTNLLAVKLGKTNNTEWINNKYKGLDKTFNIRRSDPTTFSNIPDKQTLTNVERQEKVYDPEETF